MENIVNVKNELENEFNSDKYYEDPFPKKARYDGNTNIPVGDISENENIVLETGGNLDEDYFPKNGKQEEIIPCIDLKPSIGEVVGKKDQCNYEELPKFDNVVSSDIKQEKCTKFDTDSVLCKSESIEIESKLNDTGKNTVIVKSKNKDVGAKTKRGVKSKTTSSIIKIDKIGKNKKKTPSDKKYLANDISENENIVLETGGNLDEDYFPKSGKHEEIIPCSDLKPSIGEVVGNKDQCKYEELPKFDNVVSSDIKQEKCTKFDIDSVLCKSESIEIESKLNDTGKNTVIVKSKNKDVGAKTKKGIMKIDKIGKNKKKKPSDKKHLANETNKTTNLANGSKINGLNEDDSSLSSIFEINIPLIGKNVIVDDSTPFHARYDLAIEINKKRFRHQKKEGFMIPNISFDEWRKERDGKSDAEKEKIAADKKQDDLEMAHDITRIGIRILQLLRKDVIDERRVGRLLIEFLFRPVTPTSLLYVPHFIHTIIICRGCKDFSQQLRSLADECYQRCHAMFPFALGCNFETVYTCQVRKFLPEMPIRIDELPLNYFDFSESSDSENSERAEL